MEQIMALCDAMKNDESFAEKFQSVVKGGNLSEIIEEAKKCGFDITETDWQKYAEWNENLPVGTRETKEVEEKTLESVTGGFWPGSMTNPHKLTCWFRGGGEPRHKYGTMRYLCETSLCKAIPFGESSWHQCTCWGTDRCIEKWHNSTSH